MHRDKRRKLEEDNDSDNNSSCEINGLFAHSVLSEIDLEIGLRGKLLETLESRITWALLLQESLSKEDTQQLPPPPPGQPVRLFKDAALDALDVAEAPAQILFTREEPVPPTLSQVKTRPPKTRSQLRKPQFLYIRPPTFEAGQIIILRCPQCSRSNFSTLSALFNHARMAHQLNWGTHEHCIKACSCSESREGVVLDEGLEIQQTLPGVKTLFQMAVGNEGSVVRGDGSGMQLSNGSHLARTLGLHTESPALAQFLGKEAKRKSIKVGDNEDAEVDITEVNENIAPTALWRRTYKPHNFSFPAVEQSIVKVEDTQSPSLQFTPDPSNSTINVNSSTATSRFYITTRIVILDRSLYYRPGDRNSLPSGHTHKWMLSVESPSYSHDLTTVLSQLRVTSATEPSAFEPLSTSQPPYLVVGSASQPFLARVELLFNGINEDRTGFKTIVLDHWVALDIMKNKNAVNGDQQIVDINLDKGTLFVPPKTGYLPITARSWWGDHGPKESESNTIREEKQTDMDEYARILTSLLPRFPMTVADNTGRSRRVPYKLVSTRAEFSKLVMGRRKAIEWSRSKALKEAYEEEILTSPTCETFVPLTTGDVYAWLLDEGHFIRTTVHSNAVQAKPITKPKKTNSPVPEGWCRVCGLAIANHPGMIFNGILERCDVVPPPQRPLRMPIHDINSLLYQRYTHPALNLTTIYDFYPQTPFSCIVNSLRWSYHDIVQSTDPCMIRSVQAIISKMNLPAFSASSVDTPSKFPIDRLGNAVSEVDASIAPYALIATAGMAFMRTLLTAGLESSLRNREIAASFNPAQSNRRSAARNKKTRLLTPLHLISGLITRERIREQSRGRDDASMAIYHTLARLGVAVPPTIENQQTDRMQVSEPVGVSPVISATTSTTEKVESIPMS